MKADGMTAIEIAEELGCSRQDVNRFLAAGQPSRGLRQLVAFSMLGTYNPFMIRRAVIAMLTLVAVGTGFLGAFKVPWIWASAENPTSTIGSPYSVGFLRGDFRATIEFVSVGIRPLVQRRWTCKFPRMQFEHTVLNYTDGKAREVIHGQLSATFLSTVLAAYPTIAFIRGPLRRWRRHRKGLCLNCGYNLTGNVTGKCSECGTEVLRS